MKFCFKYKKKKVCLDVERCEGLNRGIGLMFKKREKATTLLFDFKRRTRQPIHSFFMSFPFVAVWLDEENKVLEIKVFKPFTVYMPKKKFVKMLEIPINSRYKEQLRLFVGKRKV
jgi:uncharacterized membrane protein (UPF0127 family)